MAHVHRQTYTKPIPAGAERVTVKKTPCVRWRGRTGEWVVAEVIPEKPGRCRCQSAKWYVTYYDHAAGRERTVPGYTDRAATDALMVSLVRTAQRVDAGLLPPEAQRERLTMAELLDRWQRFIRHKGATEAGAHRRRQRAGAVAEGVGADRPAQLTPSAVLEWAGAAKEEHDWSDGSVIAYLSAVKGFTKWLAQVERHEPVDHLSALPCGYEPAEVRRVRRALSPEQLEELLAAARASPDTVRGLTGPERHALYLTAASTGLRAVELSRLTAADLDAAAGAVTVRRPAKARGRRTDVVPLDPEVIRLVLAVCPAEGHLWPARELKTTHWYLQGAEMIRRDLAAAGIPYRDAEGRVFDFHSLRGQFATDLDRAGVTLQRAQKLMRHADPAMTAKHYTRPEREELAKEAAKLGRGKLARQARPALGVALGRRPRKRP